MQNIEALAAKISFKRAERKQAKARIAFCAPAGGGKTHSALLVAAGLGKRIAVIDTENGSASLEAGKPGIPEFDVLRMSAPFMVEKYIAAMKAAEDAGYEIIILDSLSHAWQGTGGLLEQVDMKTKASKSQNSYAAWRDITPMHNALVEAILQSKCHIICTMRTKADYVLETGANGKQSPKKVGLAPIQREGMDYEFTVVFDIDQGSHVALASKDRTSLFDGVPFTPTNETGKILHDWIMSGAVDEVVAPPTPPVVAVEPPKAAEPAVVPPAPTAPVETAPAVAPAPVVVDTSEPTIEEVNAIMAEEEKAEAEPSEFRKVAGAAMQETAAEVRAANNMASG